MKVWTKGGMILVLVGLAVGCALTSKSSERNLYQVHLGQSPDELLAAIGEPNKKMNSGESEQWLYDIYSYDNRQIYPYRATFEKGKLTHWDFDTHRFTESSPPTNGPRNYRTPSSFVNPPF